MKSVLASDSEGDEQPKQSSSSSGVACVSSGVRQRLAEHKQDELVARFQTIGHGSDLPLNNTLKRRWAAGELSSPMVQEIAAGALKQGAVGVDGFANIGADGSQQGNLFRDLCSAFGMPLGAPAIEWVRLPFANGKSGLYPVLMPHLFFKQLYTEKPSDFRTAVLGGCEDASDFWASTTGRRFASEHPVLCNRKRNLLRKTIPLGLHGDGGEFSHQDSLYAVTWNSVLGLGSTSQKRFLFAAIKNTMLCSATWDKLWEIFGWSMTVLLHGREPIADYRGKSVHSGGQPFADNFSGC